MAKFSLLALPLPVPGEIRFAATARARTRMWEIGDICFWWFAASAWPFTFWQQELPEMRCVGCNLAGAHNFPYSPLSFELFLFCFVLNECLMFLWMGCGDKVWSFESSAAHVGWLYFPAHGSMDVIGTFYGEFHCKSKVNITTVHRIYAMWRKFYCNKIQGP